MPVSKKVDGLGNGVQSVALALKMIERLAQSPKPSRMTDLANALGMSKNRIHRHLHTLVELGYVVRDDAQRYALGVRLLQLGNTIANQSDLVTVARPILRQLRDSLGLTAVISRPLSDRMYVADYLPSLSATAVTINAGYSLQLHSTAQGKIALAFGAPDLLQKLAKAPLIAHTKRTITQIKKLKDEIEAVRKRGWAGCFEESMASVNAVAAPIYDAAGELFAALGLLGFPHQLRIPPTTNVVTMLTLSAKEISGTLFPSAIGTSR